MYVSMARNCTRNGPENHVYTFIGRELYFLGAFFELHVHGICTSQFQFHALLPQRSDFSTAFGFPVWPSKLRAKTQEFWVKLKRK